MESRTKLGPPYTLNAHGWKTWVKAASFVVSIVGAVSLVLEWVPWSIGLGALGTGLLVRFVTPFVNFGFGSSTTRDTGDRLIEKLVSATGNAPLTDVIITQRERWLQTR